MKVVLNIKDEASEKKVPGFASSTAEWIGKEKKRKRSQGRALRRKKVVGLPHKGWKEC